MDFISNDKDFNTEIEETVYTSMTCWHSVSSGALVH